MSNFGFLHLRVVNPYEVAFREARSAVGAAPLLANAEEYNSVAAAVADCTLVVGTTALRDRELQHPLHTLQNGVRVIRRQPASSRVALLFGSEKVGLSRKDMSHCHWLLRVSTRAQHPSMNLGQAVAVCLYELVRNSQPLSDIAKEPRATARHAELITGILVDALRASGYMDRDAETAVEEKVRRMVRRLDLHSADAELLLGMLRQILWKIRRKKEPSQ
jgi:tRNA/rRNA methyltransferase